MSFIQKESNIDFGDKKLNTTFENLDSEYKNIILNYSKEKQIEVLKKLQKPDFEKIWKQSMKMHIKSKPLLDKIIKKNEEQFKPQVNEVQELPPELLKTVNENENEKSRSIEENQKYSIPIQTPEELFQEELQEEKHISKARELPQTQFADLVDVFYKSHPYINYVSKLHELEVKFGTKGYKPIIRNDLDNVIKKLKSSGFHSSNNSGNYYLRINCEYLDSKSGKFKMSEYVRTEIKGLNNIQDYCKHNDLKSIYKNSPSTVSFINKKIAFEKVGDKYKNYYPVNFNDFNFRVTYNIEETVKIGVQNFILENWKKSKKIFRYLNRVTFKHDDYPVLVDISIVKSSNRGTDKYGRENRGEMIPVYTTNDSNVFNNKESYEIEIEVDNTKIGPGTIFNSPGTILEAIKKVIKLVLSGLQKTNFPISYPEQKSVIESYMNLVWQDELSWKDEYDKQKNINSKYFIGPNSKTLQLLNIAPISENNLEPNIRQDFVVTEKADGERNLMFINEHGKIYLINTNMEIIFTGAKTMNEECFNTLLDGELIHRDKNGKFINLYAAFDIYFIKKIDVRTYTFMLLNEEEDIYKCRYQLLQFVNNNLKPVSIINLNENTSKNKKDVQSLLTKFKNLKNIISPIKFEVKEFFPNRTTQTIFEGCSLILQKVKQGRFEYNTDGLIFSHAFYGVGGTEIGKSGPKTKITWDYSFKWKPPQFNTIDFLVKTLKKDTGDDSVYSIFENGISASSSIQFSEYKKIELNCGFNEDYDGYINPCQDIIDDNYTGFKEKYDNSQKNKYVPKRFYPTEPYDVNAGMCNIMLNIDEASVKQMYTEENQTFGDNMIVEFRYDFDREDGWKWVPLRVRYDKTSKFLRGEKEYGNSYKTCNDNWKSIHPCGRIDEDMITTGLNIPEITVSQDKYYNTPAGKLKTVAMKDFHNLYVKKLLIKSTSKPGDTLIDFACGKGGDLPKWINAKLSFVFGVDIAKDNLENRIDGACARYLNFKKTNKNMPYALFVNGNSAFNIKDGSAMLNDKAKQITNAVFGKGPNDSNVIGKGVSRQYGKGEEGFDISSCQFAIHYFFENPDTLKGFMKNISECTKLNGYFIGTGYDGKVVFNELRKTVTGDSIKIMEDGKKIWEIVKGYNGDTFADDSSSIGYRIDVYQESINQLISEFLINFDYLDRVMDAYGFQVISREEAHDLGLPEGSGMFSELFINMLDEIKRNKFTAKNFESAPNMTKYEKKISFLNRYFVYKKIREVNTEKVDLYLGEYEESNELRDYKETKEAVQLAKQEEKKNKPKVRKLSKKILLIPATEAVDDEIINPNIGTQIIETVKKPEKVKKTKKLKIEEEKDIEEKDIEEKDKDQEKKPEKKSKKIKKLIIIEED
jgi:hypothetical protein